MQAEKDVKKAAGVCLEVIGLDQELYRLGHTKARNSYPHTTLSTQSWKIRRLVVCYTFFLTAKRGMAMSDEHAPNNLTS